MKKVLVVGYLDYEEYKSLCKKYNDVLFVEAIPIHYDGVTALITLVEMFDEVMFVDNGSDRFSFEVTCAMMRKDVSEITDYPLNDKDKGEEQ